MIVRVSFLWVSWFFICLFLGLIVSLLGVIRGIGWFYSLSGFWRMRRGLLVMIIRVIFILVIISMVWVFWFCVFIRSGFMVVW